MLPFLVTLVLGCVDFGRFAHGYIAVTNAARAGAGWGSANAVTPTTRSEWEASVRQAIMGEMEQLSGFDPVAMPNPVIRFTNESNGRQLVSVDVSYPFDTLIRWPGIPSRASLRRVVVMRTVGK